MEEKLYNHVDLVGLLGIVDLEAGQTVAGGRGYYLINEGVLLNQVRGMMQGGEWKVQDSPTAPICCPLTTRALPSL